MPAHGTWGLTKNDENNLDSYHRRQLRQVMQMCVKYPAKMSNKNVYRVRVTDRYRLKSRTN